MPTGQSPTGSQALVGAAEAERAAPADMSPSDPTRRADDVLQPESDDAGQTVTFRGGLRVAAALAQRVINVETLLWCVAELPAEAAQGRERWMRPATSADAQALAPLSGGRRGVRKRLARGDHAVLAEEEGRVVAVVWITTRPLRLPGYGLSVDASPQVPYSYGLQVARSARRRGLGTALAYYVREVEGPRLGFRSMSYHISPRNAMTYKRHLAESTTRTAAELRVLILFGRLPCVVRTKRVS